jgi:hypothetical protein
MEAFRHGHDMHDITLCGCAALKIDEQGILPLRIKEDPALDNT